MHHLDQKKMIHIFICISINSALSLWTNFNGEPLYLNKYNCRVNQVGAFKYQQYILMWKWAVFPLKVLFMIWNSLPIAAVRSNSIKTGEKRCCSACCRHHCCCCQCMSRPTTTPASTCGLWFFMVPHRVPHWSHSALTFAGFKLCVAGSDTKPLASTPQQNLYSQSFPIEMLLVNMENGWVQCIKCLNYNSILWMFNYLSTQKYIALNL